MNIFCVLLFCQISISSLIQGLGHDDYNVRMQSYKQLSQVKHADLQLLEDNTNNDDIEIALSCRRLINEYYYVRGPKNQLPSIWYLPHNIRFPKGIKYDIVPSEYNPGNIHYNITSYPRDVSFDYIIKALDIKGVWLCEFCGAYIKCLEIASVLCPDPCEICCSENYYPMLHNQEDIFHFATDLFIKDMLKKGVERSKVQQIINQACANMDKPVRHCWINGSIDNTGCPEEYLTYAKAIHCIILLK